MFGQGEVNAGMSEDEGEKVHAGMEVTEVKHDEVDIYVISFQEVLTVDNVSPVCTSLSVSSVFVFMQLLTSTFSFSGLDLVRFLIPAGCSFFPRTLLPLK